MVANKITGRSAFISLLKDEGVTHMFGNPGTTELPIMDALTEHQDMNYLMSMQESLVVYMAEGYSRVTQKLSACNVHVAPGLGNALGAIYAAKFANTPIIITAGQQEQGHGLTEPLLYDELVPMATPLVKWAVEVSRLEDLPRIIRRAAKIALSHPMGPVFISLPGDILNEEAEINLGFRTRVDNDVVPSQMTLNKIIERILKSNNPVIISGHEISAFNAFKEAGEFASLIGAPVYQQTVQYGAHFFSEHPNFLGPLNRNQKQVRETLSEYDLLIVLGADVLRMSVWSPLEPLPEEMPIIQIGLNDWEMGKNFPTELAVRSNVKETLSVLNKEIKKLNKNEFFSSAKNRSLKLKKINWTAKREKLVQKLSAQISNEDKINPSWMIKLIVDIMSKDTIIVEEGLLSTRDLPNLLPYRDPLSLVGMASGGIGWGVPAACGIQAAYPERDIIAIIGDGSSMYSIQALWTAANQNLPVNYIICDNGGYGIIKERLYDFHNNKNFIGMDFKNPEVDFVNLGNSLGVNSVLIESYDEFCEELKKAILNKKSPNLLCVKVNSGRF